MLCVGDFRVTSQIAPDAIAMIRVRRDHDDHSLRVENLPHAPPGKGQPGLFDEEGEW
jgi:hypothetical protein